MKKLLFIGMTILMSACVNNQKGIKSLDKVVLKSNEVLAGVNLTVAESKRLIAEGIANHPDVQKKMKSGMIIITRGTTNTYIAERLIGLDASHGRFMSGHIIPEGSKKIKLDLPKIPEIILIDGKNVEMTLSQAMNLIKKDDIVLKGANLLNYERGQAAVCIGSPTGGTLGTIRPFVDKGKGRLIIPVGLEKEVWGDLNDYEKILNQDARRLNDIPHVWVHKSGEIFTEIEALKVFGKVNVIPYGAGGIAGREGGISLAIYGDSTEVKKVIEVVRKIQGEKAFIQ